MSIRATHARADVIAEALQASIQQPHEVLAAAFRLVEGLQEALGEDAEFGQRLVAALDDRFAPHSDGDVPLSDN